MRTPLLALALVAAAAPSTAAPRLEAPTDLTIADPAPFRLVGLRPGEEVELTSTRRVGDKAAVARATFRADARGRIDLATAAPLAGDYAGPDKAGLFWSAKPARAATAADPPRGQVRVEATETGRRFGAATARVMADPATLVIEPAAGLPRAVFAHPPGPGRRPAIIVLGGSEGGDYTAKAFAPLLAQQGYAVLGLPYYAPGYTPDTRIPGLPTSFTEIPVDRLAEARDWLAAQPGVDPARIGVWGASKGAEYALLAATRFPWIKAVAAVVPTDVVWEGWGRPGPPTASFGWQGKALPFQPYEGMDVELAKAAKGQGMELRGVHDAGRRVHPERMADARIPAERFKGSLVLIGGGEDRVWPSAEMAERVAATRKAAGLPTVLVVEPKAGHALGGLGYDPAAAFVPLGGEADAIARARRLGWKATLETFAATLHPERVGS